MKVNIPIKKKDSIDLTACDLLNGLLVSKNPYGVIMKSEDKDYNFHESSCYDQDYTDESLLDLVETLVKNYPNITFEYFENED